MDTSVTRLIDAFRNPSIPESIELVGSNIHEPYRASVQEGVVEKLSQTQTSIEPMNTEKMELLCVHNLTQPFGLGIKYKKYSI